MQSLNHQPNKIEDNNAGKNIHGSSPLDKLICLIYKNTNQANINDIYQLYFNKIYAALISVAARQYCSNKIKERNVSLLNDLETISILLPYCDVMIVDNECREFLNQNDAKKHIYPCKTKIFSKNNIVFDFYFTIFCDKFQG